MQKLAEKYQKLYNLFKFLFFDIWQGLDKKVKIPFTSAITILNIEEVRVLINTIYIFICKSGWKNLRQNKS